MASLEPAQAEKAVNAIKHLTIVKARLEKDLQESKQSEEKTKAEYQQLRIKYDDLMKQKSTTLTAQNVKQRQSLEAHYVNLLKAKDSTIEHLQNIIAAKDEELSKYNPNAEESQSAAQASEMKIILQKVFSLSKMYAADISALQGQAYSVDFSTNQETVQAQAASGDEDLNGSATLSLNSFDTQVENLKSDNKELNRQLEVAVQQQKTIQMKLDESMASVLKLEDEKEKLIKEKDFYMERSNENILAAQKVFQDDFDCERNEKIQKNRENEKLKGENEKLKGDCEKLQAKLRSLHLNSHDNERMHANACQPILQPSTLEATDLNEQHQGYSSNAWHSERPPLQHHQEFPLMENQAYARQASVSVHPQISHPHEPTRRIGFQSAVSPEHTPTGISYNNQSHGPRHASSMQAQPYLRQFRSVQADTTIDGETEVKPTKTADEDQES